MLVEDVSSNEESEDDQCSYLWTSSTESYDDELKALYDDRESGTRWINQFTATPLSLWTPDATIRNVDAFDDFDKSQYPPGSTIDMSRPSSPVDLCDFPYLDLTPRTYNKQDIQPPPLDIGSPQGDQVIYLRCTIRTIGLPENDEAFPKFIRKPFQITLTLAG